VNLNHSAQTDIDLVVSLNASEEPVVTRQISLEPTIWWEWQCPSCQETYDRSGLCPECHSPLRRTQVSLPFIWIG
jgi:rRNA maturation endonuclease Nob1